MKEISMKINGMEEEHFFIHKAVKSFSIQVTGYQIKDTVTDG